MRTLGVDIGTTSLSILLLENGVVLHTENLEHNARLRSHIPYEHTQDPALIYGLVHSAASAVWDEYGQFDAISVTGQMHGIVYLGESGEAVSPLFTWLDLRGDEQSGQRNMTYRMALHEATGYDLPAGYGILCHYWHSIHNAIPHEAVCFTGIIDYVAMKLAGLHTPTMNPSNAASLGFFRLSDLSFDAEALAEALTGVEANMLPAVATSYSPIGAWRGAPVFCAVGDNQASFAGAVEQYERSVFVNVGTGSQISCFTPNPIDIPGLETRPFPTGGFLVVGAGLSGGKSYAILRDLFRSVMNEFGPKDERTDLFDVMNRLALGQPPDADPKVITQFFGTRQDGAVRGVIEGISASNFTCGGLVRGFVDGMVSELMGFWNDFPSSVKNQIDVLVGAGNGIRRNIALQRAFERSFGIDMTLAPRIEEAAFGAATLAGQWLHKNG